MNNNLISTVLKGLCVGGTMLVPGVSGGSMAMILGIYDKLVSSVSSFMKHKKESLIFLALFSLGGLVGMVLFAKPLLMLIEKYPMPMLYFFIGTVAGGVPLMYRKTRIKKVSWKTFLYLILGIAVVLLFQLFPANTPGDGTTSMGFGILAIAGFVAALALVLPGISVSYVLLLMGIYDSVMKAFASFHVMDLLPLGIGLILGIILTTKILESAMTKYPGPTYLVIIGFILGSLVEIFPGIPSGLDWIGCLLTLAAGFLIISLLIGKKE